MIDDAASIPDLAEVLNDSAIRIATSGQFQAVELSRMLCALAVIAHRNTPPSIMLDILAKAVAKVNPILKDYDEPER